MKLSFIQISFRTTLALVGITLAGCVHTYPMPPYLQPVRPGWNTDSSSDECASQVRALQTQEQEMSVFDRIFTDTTVTMVNTFIDTATCYMQSPSRVQSCIDNARRSVQQSTERQIRTQQQNLIQMLTQQAQNQTQTNRDASRKIENLRQCRIASAQRVRADFDAKRLSRDEALSRLGSIRQQAERDRSLIASITGRSRENINVLAQNYTQLPPEPYPAPTPQRPATPQRPLAEARQSQQQLEREAGTSVARVNENLDDVFNYVMSTDV